MNARVVFVIVAAMLSAVLDEAARQLDAYFSGELTDFDLPLSMAGTEFQRRVWDCLRSIPYGDTWTYGQVAEKVGNSRAFRAVGMANNRNPIAIIVPCHRVIGADGSLTGYGGGLQRKQMLLDLEAAVSGGAPPPGVWAGRQLSLIG